MSKSFKKVYVYYCKKCRETFEAYDGQHRKKCPGCESLCSVKESRNEE